MPMGEKEVPTGGEMKGDTGKKRKKDKRKYR
jgi:hypothetical protein